MATLSLSAVTKSTFYRALLVAVLVVASALPSAAADINDVRVKVERIYQEMPVTYVVVSLQNSAAARLSYVNIECGLFDSDGNPLRKASSPVADVPARSRVIEEIMTTESGGEIARAECRPTGPRFE